ncbi:unnamed protein product [Mesocestoides corti]|uniref:Uncharacterized protein n=2 Tax=Mesocestoides corti TaxID=53468 RepID=A0A158QSG7_MESCO|nr:unnamed protein product [Mesocestoides corti]
MTRQHSNASEVQVMYTHKLPLSLPPSRGLIPPDTRTCPPVDAVEKETCVKFSSSFSSSPPTSSQTSKDLCPKDEGINLVAFVSVGGRQTLGNEPSSPKLEEAILRLDRRLKSPVTFNIPAVWKDATGNYLTTTTILTIIDNTKDGRMSSKYSVHRMVVQEESEADVASPTKPCGPRPKFKPRLIDAPNLNVCVCVLEPSTIPLANPEVGGGLMRTKRRVRQYTNFGASSISASNERAGLPVHALTCVLVTARAHADSRTHTKCADHTQRVGHEFSQSGAGLGQVTNYLWCQRICLKKGSGGREEKIENGNVRGAKILVLVEPWSVQNREELDHRSTPEDVSSCLDSSFQQTPLESAVGLRPWLAPSPQNSSLLPHPRASLRCSLVAGPSTKVIHHPWAFAFSLMPDKRKVMTVFTAACHNLLMTAESLVYWYPSSRIFIILPLECVRVRATFSPPRGNSVAGFAGAVGVFETNALEEQVQFAPIGTTEVLVVPHSRANHEAETEDEEAEIGGCTRSSVIIITIVTLPPT